MPENPLSVEDIKIASQTARSLRILISNAQLYSPKSQLVKDGISNLLKVLEPYISARGSITFSESEKNLIIDGQVLKTADKSGLAFVENMVQCELRSITLLKGISDGEILTLVENMSVKKKELRENIEKMLKDRGQTHIEVNQKIYVAQGDAEEIVDTAEPAGQESLITPSATVSASGTKTEGQDNAVDFVKEELTGTAAGKSEDKAAVPVPATSTTENITFEATRAVSGEKRELIRKERSGELRKMLRDLDGINRADLAGQVVDRIAENLQDKEKHIRLQTVRSFKQLNPTIQQLSDKNIINNLEEKFISTEERETEEEVYKELADLLEETANRNLAEGNYERVVQVTKMFRLHRYARGEGFESRSTNADKILEKLANSGLVNILVTDLRSEDKKKKEEAYKVVASLEEYAVYYLITTLKEIEDLHLRKVIAFLIKNLGESAVKLLCEAITPEISSEEAIRIIEVLDSIEYYDVAFDELKAVYSHFNPEVRKSVLDMLAKIKPDRVGELLLTALDDLEPRLVKEAIRLSGKVRAAELVDRLTGIIALESTFVRKRSQPVLEEEACIALGKIGNKASIVHLVRVVVGGGFFSFKKEKPMNVRIAGLHALASFPAGETKAIINRFTVHSDKSISWAAKEALKFQERSSEKKNPVG